YDFLSRQIYSTFSVFSLEELAVKIGLSAGIYIAFHIFSAIMAKYVPGALQRIFKLKNENFIGIFSESFSKPISYFLRFLGGYLAISYLPFNPVISVILNGLMTKFIRIALIVLVSISAQNFIAHAPVLFKGLNAKLESKNKTIINFFSKLGKAVIIVFTAVILLGELGYDINGLIAGLGLSGLTFALAAQDTASNFVSGLVILMDKPFAIGDWISVAGMEGIVEEMNFRSCRIRTFDNALIAVPNNKISGDSVTNWTKMNMRKTRFKIGLIYQTSKQTIQKVCDEITACLNGFEEIKKDSILVRFDSFNSSSLDIVIQYNSYPIAIGEHLALKEKVQYAVMDIINANDTDFAFNTQTVYQYKMTE
ncbi:MAG: mechanosensitive ion channel family protein, partial [Oscillospiraceae bacterium]